MEYKQIITPQYATIKKIHHIADIQIRLIKRHAEFKEVFDRMFEILEKDKENSIIVVAGDVVHNKTEMSPELVDLTSYFLKGLANITTTIVFPGNHDGNLANKNRMDSIYPINNLINSPNLHYLKDSGLYKCANLTFSAMTVFDEVSQFSDAETITDGNVKIALYHGTLNGSVSDTGFVFSNSDLDMNYFDGFDIVILGDIHQVQHLQKYGSGKPAISYCGSLVQQNHGESLEKGFLTWNVAKREPKFVKVHNDFGYFTVKIEHGKLLTKIDNIPNKVRLRVQVIDTDLTAVKQILAEVRKKTSIQETVINNLADSNYLTAHNPVLTIGEIRNVDVQNGLIIDYLTRTNELSDDMIARIKKINAKLNAKLTLAEMLSNIIWKLKRFEFSNMFSYGENNVVDFSNMSGIVGLFAGNHSGKSAVVDSLSFNLFDKSARAFRACDILNTRKDRFDCKVNFSIDDIDYFVKRGASKRKYTDQIKVDVDFWCNDDTGDMRSLNGEARRSTDDNIRSYIGDFDDISITALLAQNAVKSFVDLGQTERKDLLTKFLGIDVLEELYKLGADEIKEVQILLKDFHSRDCESELLLAQQRFDDERENYSVLNKSRKALSARKESTNSELFELAKQLITVDKDIVDIDLLNRTRVRLEKKITDMQQKIDELNTTTDKNQGEYNAVEKQFEGVDETSLGEGFDELCRLEHERDSVQQQLDTLQVDVKHKLDKLKNLEKHEYDPNCKFCVNNVFVKDALQTKESLKDDEQVVSSYKAKLEHLKSSIEEKIHYRKMYTDFTKTRELKTKIVKRQLENNVELAESEGQLNTSQFELISVQEKIRKHDELGDVLKHNEEVNDAIDELKLVNGTIAEELNDVEKKFRTSYSAIRMAETEVESIKGTIQKAKELEDELNAYEYYLDATRRDGIPYDLISRVVPEIEREVNNILHQIVDFSIKWELDGKNVNVMIVYDDDKKWPLDMTSGMERFISNIAIRVGLMNVSGLPRPNCLIIDEGFGVLDADNANNISMLFDYLKTHFDFILIITHLDALKDTVDTVIEVSVDSDGFSHINYD